ncbi:aspartate dehydrogenase domain-containing protein [Prauserella alba]|uniref:L-aspartate dehydrogenase n=1 Tax=Prauserella alba TaxID=176898 RepID=A0ABN1VCG8_9PSEU|nr:aspartate dehydrogenase domain-containing protein [Prauserella alba]MCP2178912.1 aspartate dehydrogenase [Prauserella alba]
MKVAVLGCGAIGGAVAHALAAGSVAGADLVGVVHADPVDPPGLPVIGFEEAIGCSDLVVECAGQPALRSYGPRVLRAGVDLLVVSTGALVDDELFTSLTEADGGKLSLSTGAIGGLDMVVAATGMGGLDRATLTTTKRAVSLIQPWMSEAEARRLTSAREPIELMRGSARTIASAFPKSANVAASLALAVGDWERVEAAVVADPNAELTSHVITAEGGAGSYRFEVRNHPSAETPTTSGVVPHAVLRAIRSLAGGTVFR